MPLWKKPEKQNLVLLVYHLETGEKIAEFYSDQVKRKSPLVFKESGEKRLELHVMPNFVSIKYILTKLCIFYNYIFFFRVKSFFDS